MLLLSTVHMKKNQNSLNNLKPNRSPWNNSETVAIRIPKVFKEQVLLYTRQLDSGKLTEKTDTQNDQFRQNLTEIMVKVDAKEKGYKTNSAGQLIKDLKELANSSMS